MGLMKDTTKFVLLYLTLVGSLIVSSLSGLQSNVSRDPENYRNDQIDGSYFDGYSKATDRKYYYQHFQEDNEPNEYYRQDPDNSCAAAPYESI